MKKSILFSLGLIMSQALSAQEMPKLVEQMLQEHNLSKSLPQSTSGSVQERGTIDCKPDSIVSFFQDGLLQDSVIMSRLIFLYDSRGNRIKSTLCHRQLVTDPLELLAEVYYTYNSLDVLTSYENQVTSSTFCITIRYDYYPKGNSTTLLDSIVEGSPRGPGMLYRNNRYIPEYDAAGKETRYYRESYDPLLGWQNDSLRTFTYNAKDQITSQLLFDWNGSEYVPIESIEYRYDAVDSLVHILSTNLVKNKPFERSKTTYDLSDRLTTTINEFSTGGPWNYYSTSKYQVDALKREILSELVRPGTGGFFGQRWEYFYSGNTSCISFIRSYSGEKGIFQPVGPSYYYYKGKITDTKDLAIKSAQCFPNPVQDQGLTVVAEQGSRVQLHNSLGQLVLEQETINEQSTLPTAQLHNGTYFLKIIGTNGKAQTAQVIKMD
jgi:Secretion system C-terminal sorting domain